MFFLATADAEGRPSARTRVAIPGFVRVVDERTIAFPSWDGNGMFLSAGNVLEPARRPPVHRLRAASRLRLNGVASIDDADPLCHLPEGSSSSG